MSQAELPDVDVLDVFEIDDRGRLVTLDPSRRPPPPAPRAPSRSPADRTETSRNRPPRPPAGPAGTSSAPPPAVASRGLGRRDVRCAVYVDPVEAAESLTDGALLAGIDDLDTTGAHPRIDGATLSWDVTLRRRRWNRPVPTELCIHPSPSWVMTVIELRPVGRRRPSGFVRSGLRIAEEISDRLTTIDHPSV